MHLENTDKSIFQAVARRRRRSSVLSALLCEDGKLEDLVETEPKFEEPPSLVEQFAPDSVGVGFSSDGGGTSGLESDTEKEPELDNVLASIGLGVPEAAVVSVKEEKIEAVQVETEDEGALLTEDDELDAFDSNEDAVDHGEVFSIAEESASVDELDASAPVSGSTLEEHVADELETVSEVLNDTSVGTESLEKFGDKDTVLEPRSDEEFISIDADAAREAIEVEEHAPVLESPLEETVEEIEPIVVEESFVAEDPIEGIAEDGDVLLDSVDVDAASIDEVAMTEAIEVENHDLDMDSPLEEPIAGIYPVVEEEAIVEIDSVDEFDESDPVLESEFEKPVENDAEIVSEVLDDDTLDGAESVEELVEEDEVSESGIDDESVSIDAIAVIDVEEIADELDVPLSAHNEESTLIDTLTESESGVVEEDPSGELKFPIEEPVEPLVESEEVSFVSSDPNEDVVVSPIEDAMDVTVDAVEQLAAEEEFDEEVKVKTKLPRSVLDDVASRLIDVVDIQGLPKSKPKRVNAKTRKTSSVTNKAVEKPKKVSQKPEKRTSSLGLNKKKQASLLDSYFDGL